MERNQSVAKFNNLELLPISAKTSGLMPDNSKPKLLNKLQFQHQKPERNRSGTIFGWCAIGSHLLHR